MTQLFEMPSNAGRIQAIDPHHVTGVQSYRSTLPGRGSQLFDMSVVWIGNRNLFVCSWSVEDTVKALNAARRADAGLFREGYLRGMEDALAGSADEQILALRWDEHLLDQSHPEDAK